MKRNEWNEGNEIKERRGLRKGTYCILLGLLLLLSSLGLTMYNFWDEDRADAVAVERVQVLKTQIPDLEEEDLPPELIPDHILNPGMAMPVVEIEGHEYIGYLNIPILGLDLPVMATLSYPKLKIAPCRYAGSAYLDNLIIAAHNYKRHFGTIKNLSIGDAVTFTDIDGNVFTYQVVEVTQYEPYQAAELRAGEDWDLTLFTCTLGGRHRVTVRCERTQDPTSQY